jgi:D-alanyl-D-alanine carboxypeptidase (penicillin-binding protein 5/6)
MLSVQEFRRRKMMSRFFRNGWLLLVVCHVFITLPGQQDAWAAKAACKGKSRHLRLRGGFPYDAQCVVLTDALSGQVLYDKFSKEDGANFVKILTLYIALDAIRSGQLKLEDWVTVSESLEVEGSKMFIKVGDRVKVEDLLKGIAIASGNDACIAWQNTWQDRRRYLSQMNEKASLLRLKDSRFTNSHGMPDGGEYTTAMDVGPLWPSVMWKTIRRR